MTKEEALRYLGPKAQVLTGKEGVDTSSSEAKASIDKDAASKEETSSGLLTHHSVKKDLPPQTISSTSAEEYIPSPSFPFPLKEEDQPLDREKGYQKLEFSSGAEVLAFFRDDIREGRFKLHQWQIEENEKIASFKATTQKPLRYCLCAANGSGKDAMIIAANAIFFCLAYIKARVIITSAGGVQLTGQTEAYIRDLANLVNKKFGLPYFKINQRYIKCNFSGSEVRMFATDEPGKAEGYHPFPDAPIPILVMIVNEAKSVPEEINQALKRCTVSHWLYVSSPGEPKGSFHWAATNYEKLGGYSTRITSFQCVSPQHRSLDTIEQDRLEFGEHSAIYRSKHLALFTALDGQCVISEDSINALLKIKVESIGKDWPLSVGIDSAAGGDECTVCITRGNTIVKELFFREKDTTKSTDKIHDFLELWNVPKDSEHINADDGGVSKAITDGLARRGWRINRILNQWAAFNKRDFGNRGAENWFKVARFIQLKLLDLSLLTEKTISQLKSRHYRKGEKDRTYLKKKSEEKAEGFDSPDRADAYVLSLCRWTVEDFLGENSANKANQKPRHIVDVNTLVKEQMEIKYANFNRQIGANGPAKQSANGYLLNPSAWRESQWSHPIKQATPIEGKRAYSLSELISPNTK